MSQCVDNLLHESVCPSLSPQYCERFPRQNRVDLGNEQLNNIPYQKKLSIVLTMSMPPRLDLLSQMSWTGMSRNSRALDLKVIFPAKTF